MLRKDDTGDCTIFQSQNNTSLNYDTFTLDTQKCEFMFIKQYLPGPCKTMDAVGPLFVYCSLMLAYCWEAPLSGVVV